MKKGKILLLIALIVSVLYMIYSFNYWGNVITSANTDTDMAGAGIATMLVMPHLVLAGIATIFNTLAFFLYSRPFALVAAILYTVAIVVFPAYFMFVLLQMILCFIAFSRMEKKHAAD